MLLSSLQAGSEEDVLLSGYAGLQKQKHMLSWKKAMLTAPIQIASEVDGAVTKGADGL